MARRIQAPGVEINEFDRSQYGNKPDYGLPNAPAMLVTGFADKGPDYVLQWINSPATLVKTYGYPTNEAEKYFYNAQLEILGRGGYCITAKLPYFNKSKDKYVYSGYTVDEHPHEFVDIVQCLNNRDEQRSSLIGKTLLDFLLFPYIDQTYIDTSKETASSYSWKSESNIDEIRQYYTHRATDFNPSKLNLSELFRRNRINLKLVEDFILYVDDKCHFEYEAKRVFNALFYDELDIVNPTALKLLKDIFEGKTFDFLRDNYLGVDIDRYKTQIESIRKSLNSIVDIPDFESLVKSFVYSNGIKYFVDYVQYLLNSIRNANYTSQTTDDKYVLEEAMLSFSTSNLSSREYMSLKTLDSSLSKYRKITSNAFNDNGKMSFEDYDRMMTGELKPHKNQFYIVDKTRSKYSNVSILSGETKINQKIYRDKDILGIVPIVTTAVNALYFQQMIDIDSENISSFNVVSSLMSLPTTSFNQFVVDNNCFEIERQNFATQLCQDEFELESISKTAMSFFPQITTKIDNYLDRKYMKNIGVVVLQAFQDSANNNKINFNVLESFVGSLDKDAQDDDTKSNIYIGNLINSNSQYVSFFSNVDVHDDKDEFDTYLIANQTATSLGFYLSECEKDISYSESINKPLNIILDHSKNAYELPLDVIVDAGVSNIAQFINSVYYTKGYGKYTFNTDNLIALKEVQQRNVGAWKTILTKFDNFCKEQRMCRDCMFIADGLRHFCLYGNSKRIRPTDVHSSFMRDVFPGLKYMQALDSSYSAGYCNWYMAIDNFTKDPLWLPPSIKAAGVYIYTDTYYHPWDAPAGLNRGVLDGVYDVAFNPTIWEAGKLYNQQWNYSISYPIDGIVLEGQKTFQRNKTALDRINVRRLMLYLEKQVVRIGRHFLYEGNTEYLRQRFIDALTPIFEDCENGNGIKEFAIKCDDENNTIETIENHELHVKIAVKPVKTLEFLVCDFIVTNQSATVSEEVLV